MIQYTDKGVWKGEKFPGIFLGVLVRLPRLVMNWNGMMEKEWIDGRVGKDGGRNRGMEQV